MAQLRKGGSFAAQGDDGRHYLVFHWTEFVDMTEGSPGRPRWEPSGFECLRLEDGRTVNTREGGHYEIDGSAVQLDPIAQSPRSPHPGAQAPADDARTAPADADPATIPALMAEFGVKRSGRFYVCHGYHYARIEDAVAYARQARARPELALQEAGTASSAVPGRPGELELPSAEDLRLMAPMRIAFNQGQYVCDGFRYDRLHDALAYAKQQHALPTH